VAKPADLIRLMRPRQWTKNIFVLAGAVFGEQLFIESAMIHAVAATALFTLLSASIYVLNDLRDRERDRLHPTKRDRPIAAGRISPVTAGAVGFALFVVSMTASWVVFPEVSAVFAVYAAINVFYTLWWKHIVVLDILSVSSGFVLRVVAGALAVNVPVSPWFLICTLFLALLISLGKRRSEVILLGDDASGHRTILDHYPRQFIDMLIVIVSTTTVIAYTIFTIGSGHGALLMVTIPFVLYGVFRYLYLLYVQEVTDPPEILVMKDKSLLVDVILWVTTTAAIYYMEALP
jgi:4-hydroxybenzoate polyprenyltransferase